MEEKNQGRLIAKSPKALNSNGNRNKNEKEDSNGKRTENRN